MGWWFLSRHDKTSPSSTMVEGKAAATESRRRAELTSELADELRNGAVYGGEPTDRIHEILELLRRNDSLFGDAIGQRDRGD